MKKLLCLVLALVLCLACLSSFAEGDTFGADGATAGKTIGYIIPGPDNYCQVQRDSFIHMADIEGWTVQELNAEWSFANELSIVEDLIEKGVDAIIVQTNNAAACGEEIEKAAAAGIPFFLVAGSGTEDQMAPVCVVEGNWAIAGTNAVNLIHEAFPDGAKVAIIGGAEAAIVTMSINEAFDARNEELNANIETVYYQPAEYQRAIAMEKMQDLISSSIDFDVVFVHNADMANGSLQVMQEAGVIKPIVTCNGNSVDIAMVKEGTALGTTEFCPTKEGYLMFRVCKAVLEGKTVAPNVPNAGVLITKDNLNEVIPWDTAEFYTNYIGQIWDYEAEFSQYVK